jgi:hypothetical protein
VGLGETHGGGRIDAQQSFVDAHGRYNCVGATHPIVAGDPNARRRSM